MLLSEDCWCNYNKISTTMFYLVEDEKAYICKECIDFY